MQTDALAMRSGMQVPARTLADPIARYVVEYPFVLTRWRCAARACRSCCRPSPASATARSSSWHPGRHTTCAALPLLCLRARACAYERARACACVCVRGGMRCPSGVSGVAWRVWVLWRCGRRKCASASHSRWRGRRTCGGWSSCRPRTSTASCSRRASRAHDEEATACWVLCTSRPHAGRVSDSSN